MKNLDTGRHINYGFKKKKIEKIKMRDLDYAPYNLYGVLTSSGAKKLEAKLNEIIEFLNEEKAS